MENEFSLVSERIDDFVLLIKLMMRLGLPGILDQHLPRHWLQEGLSWGWVATIWLAHIVSRGDHRKLTVRDWVRQAHQTLEDTTGLSIRETDFTDDRLTIVLRNLSKPQSWQAIERDLGQNTIRIYELTPARVRLDATTLSGYHEGTDSGLFQFGNSKDNPALRQVKLMMGTLDPLGLPLATLVVSGERADDGLYQPLVDRVVDMLAQADLLFVGDCKMSAWQTRSHIRARGQHYLSPLALVGETPKDLRGWIQDALTGQQPLSPIVAPEAAADDPPLAQGYERSRVCTTEMHGQALVWTERVLVVHSSAYAETLTRALLQRLATATAKLMALTPARGRGKRQITEKGTLLAAANAILQRYGVEGLLTYRFERQVEQQLKFVGRGRGGAERPQRLIERVRYQLLAVQRDEVAIAALQQTFGWRAYVTDVPAAQLSLNDAVLTYRAEWQIERGFHRLKGAPLSISPLFVKRDDQVVGLTHLLTIAVRLLTLIEFVVRRALQREQSQLVGLHAESPKHATERPTTERLLQAFSNITLTIIQLPERVVRHLTPLTALQIRILELLNLSPDIYRSLADNSS
jgi:transposase